MITEGKWQLIKLLLSQGKKINEILKADSTLRSGELYARIKQDKIRTYKSDPKNLKYHSPQYLAWREAAMEMDKVCVLCGGTKNLQVDHIRPSSLFPQLRFKLENARVLCFKCHKTRTTTFGRSGINRTRKGMK